MNIADREVGDIKNRRGIEINNMQNKKISQVTDETETVVVNIGSNSHWAPPALMRGYKIKRYLSTSISLTIQHHDFHLFMTFPILFIKNVSRETL